MDNTREAILHGAAEAARLDRSVSLKERVLDEWGRIDVYRLAAQLEVPVMFRPIEGLQGVFMDSPTPGILITNRRPPSVQRLTCAHELGHFYMRHGESFDEPEHIGFAYLKTAHGKSMELEADSFAFSLMMPRYLLQHHASQLISAGLSPWEPELVYQLSLRLGCSFTATALTLQQLRFITSTICDNLLEIPVKTLKQRLVAPQTLDNWNGDIWLLTENDRRYPLQPSVNDVFVIQVHQLATAGFVTEIDHLENLGFTVIREEVFAEPKHVSDAKSELHTSSGKSDVRIGGASLWESVLHLTSPGESELNVIQKRPWEIDGNPLTVMSVPMSIRPREPLGLSFEEKQIDIQRSIDSGNKH